MSDRPKPPMTYDELARSIDLVPVAVLISETSTRRIVAVNEAAAQLFATTPEQLLATTVTELTHPDSRAELSANYARSGADGGFETLKRYQRFDGTEFMGQLRARPTVGHPGLVTAVVTAVEDVDRLRNEIVASASIDELTGALRRGTFLDAARLFASMHERYAVLFLDVDGLKPVNDTLGHDAGDELLKAVATRVRASFRHGDLLGRFGGDEFVVFVSDLSGPGEVARLIAALDRRVCQPMQYEGHTINVSASIGASLCTGTVPVLDAIAEADERMLEQKRDRRGGRGSAAKVRISNLA